MSVLTEQLIRAQFADTDLSTITEYVLPPGTVVTPSAKAWLIDQRIELVGAGGAQQRSRTGSALPRPRAGSKGRKPAVEAVSALPAFSKPDHYELLDGSTVTEKDEHMTALAGNVLVPKDHPVIRLRGQLDGLEAQLILAQVTFQRLKLAKGVADLADVLSYVQLILRAEVLGVRLEERPVIGMTQAEIREMSHNPLPVFGIPHFMTNVDDGEAVATLNLLRTKVREVELAAYDAFKREGRPPRREDLIRALNRLSSVFYIMMFRAKTRVYR
jgi:ethanolamine utilization cobalamin adenosyltransferase